MAGSVTCPRESDVLDLVAVGQWPARADADLREHVDECQICRDLAATAMAFSELDHEPTGDLRIPDASIVWYRAAVDARREATRRAKAPFVLVETAAAVAVAGLLWAFRGNIVPWATAAWRTFVSGLAAATPGVQPAAWMTGALEALWWMGLLAGCSTAVVLLAVYLARLADRGSDSEVGRPGQTS